MRVGITTGQVAVTLAPLVEGMVAGDAVNTAARVQSVAAPGQVWVDDTTRSLTTRVPGLRTDAASFELKGKSGPVPLFHAVRTTRSGRRRPACRRPRSAVRRSRPRPAAGQGAVPRDGRGEPAPAAADCGRARHRQVPAGWEFEKYVDAIPTHTTYWMRARCLSYGEGVAGRTVAELIRYLLRLSDTDDEATAASPPSTSGSSRARYRPGASARCSRPRLESLLGLTDRIFEQADLFACWRTFLESLHRDG